MKLSCLFFLLLLLQQVSAQDLIANGTFEDVNICAEFNKPCAPEAWRTVSPFLPQYLSAATQKGFDKHVGIPVFNTGATNVRNYMQSQLICPMIQGKIYQFSIRLKSDDHFLLGSIGVLFSDSLIFQEKEKLLQLKPSIDLGATYGGLSRKVRKGWVTIRIDYTASGKEKYIVIGNFQTDQEQTRILLETPKPFSSCYYFLDDISLLTPDTSCWCANSAEMRTSIYKQDERHSFTRPIPAVEIPVDIPVGISVQTDTINLGDLSFKFNAFEIDSATRENLRHYFAGTDAADILSIDIYGHTDSIGSNSYNLELSEKRAIAIRNMLDEIGLSALVREVKGVGDGQPVSTNDTEAGRKLNRRVQLIIQYKTR
jgi:outer membrane protein OmpA-like peptidoglycan-associated protein